MAKDWQQTVTGRKFHSLDPDPAELDWDDIATALSNLCRYTGHVRDFYSVAQHSVLVSRRAAYLAALERDLLGNIDPEWVLYHARWGLLHDAAEAYLNDLARPVKHAPELAGYRVLETAIQRAVAYWAGLGWREPELVKAADLQVYAAEVRDLKRPIHPDWWRDGLEGLTPIPETIRPVPPAEARRMFLDEALALGMITEEQWTSLTAGRSLWTRVCDTAGWLFSADGLWSWRPWRRTPAPETVH